MPVGRIKPYTVKEIGQRRCIGCGQPAAYQWNCCANDNRWMAVCQDCDVALNEMVLAFFRVKDRTRLLAAYRRRVIAKNATRCDT